MIRNKWMILCLLAGSILSVAMISSIPMYTDAVLQRMLTRDLENYQEYTGYFPGRYLAKLNYSFIPEERRVEAFNTLNRKFTKSYVNQINLPITAQNQSLKINNLVILPERRKDEKNVSQMVDLEAISGIEKHIKIIHGRMYNNKPKGNTYEVIVSEAAMQKLDIFLNDEIYIAPEIDENLGKPFKFKVVGVCTVKDKRDPYWAHNLIQYDETFLINYDVFFNEFIKTNSSLLTNSEWYFAFDYHEMVMGSINNILEAYHSQTKWLNEYVSILDLKMPAIPFLEDYHTREKSLRVTLWILFIPILLMLAFYIFMVSQLIVENDRNEIAVLKSRGASSFQIFLCYLTESLILSGAALAAGPFLGHFLCRLLGSANGFLDFVNRSALPVKLSKVSFMYSLWATVLFVIAMLIPVVYSTKTTIVQYKQKLARSKGMPFWKKYFIDIILLSIACYGYYRYNQQQEILKLSGLMGIELDMDHILFLTTTVFILGMGLVFLRVYPYFVELVFRAGRKIWSPSLYASFIQVGRSRGQEQFLMLFLIFSISVGIYNANSARTINNNIVDKIYYSTGADITVKGDWGGGTIYTEESMEPVTLPYVEPDFTPYTELGGVDEVTKVLKKDKVEVRAAGNTIYYCDLMGIIPNEFGKVTWFRNDLLSYHWYNYLNFLTESPKAVILSSSFKEKNVQAGDAIRLTWDGQDYLECVVYGFVEYWPTFNPRAEEESRRTPYLVVANLSYIQSFMSLEPYEIWMKKKPGSTSTEIYKDMTGKKIRISERSDAKEGIVKRKKDPMLQATNGALTMGFVVTMLIGIIGFLIYWILSIQQRILQFGIFRAMGLSLKKVISMLICEQFLISGIAAVTGILVGGLTSDLFVPLLQLIYSSAQQVPPFKITAFAGDYEKIYMFVGGLLVTGLAILTALVSRINIGQAIKLGEE